MSKWVNFIVSISGMNGSAHLDPVKTGSVSVFGIYQKAEAISQENIVEELIRQILGLYAIYEDIIWSSDNNYRDFYDASKSGKF